MALPTFQKLGAKLMTPSWLSSTGNQVMFPRLFDNDAHRATLPNLPASRFSVLYSSDHSNGTGYIGRADFDDIEGTWTDSGAAIHSAANQRETPHPVYDPVNNRVNVYVHDNTSTGSNASQATRLLTTTDLTTLTDQGEVMTYGHHTGYAQVWYDSGFKSVHVMTGGEYVVNGYSTSANGTTWTLQRLIQTGQNHVANTNNCLMGDPFVFTWEGDTYLLTNLQTRPRAHASRVRSLCAVKIDHTTFRPMGTHLYVLVCPGGETATDYRFDNHNSMVSIDGTLYLLYDARNRAGTSGGLHVAKANGGTARAEPFKYPVLADGELYRGATVTTLVDWNAVSDALPGTITKAVTAGVDTSTHQAGTNYRLSGTGSPDLWLYGATSVPSDSETVEFSLAGVTYTASGSGQLRLGFNAGTTTFTEYAYLDWGESARGGGSVMLSSTRFPNPLAAWTIPYFDTAGSAQTQWMRSRAVTLSVRLSDYGRRFSLLVDGHVTVSRDLTYDGMTWTQPVRPFVRYTNGSQLFLTRWTVTRYT